MQSLVSVIIPVYNTERYIEQCIYSVLNQTYKNTQIIIVNDGSTDSSAKIIIDISKKFPNIEYIDQMNAGVANARNTALQYVRGEYILFIDSDDYLNANYIEEMVEAARINNSELVISGYTLVRENGEIIKQVIPEVYISGEREEWAYRICSTAWRLYSADFWKNHNLQFLQEKDARAEDVPVAMYANVMAKNICIIQNGEYYYRQHNESAMHKNSGYFKFPYRAFELYHQKIMADKRKNSIEFYFLGILKLFAFFEYTIYRNAEKTEKRELRQYFIKILHKSGVDIIKLWKKERWKIHFPLVHKIAMELFVIKYHKELQHVR